MFLFNNYILLMICFVTAAASVKFRSDYTYHSDIDGWLKFHFIPGNFVDARERCFMEGAVLASPYNEKMQSALRLEMNKSTPDCGIFTGIHSIFSKGYFHSIEGTPLSKMPLKWMSGEPDNANNNEDCIAYIANGSVADVNCSEVLPFVCYKKKVENTSVMPCGTTDRGYEFLATGSCYKFHTVARPWADAYKICSAEGAYLAVINSELEASVLKTLLSMHSPKITFVIYVGFHDWDKTGVWRTVHGQTLTEAGYSLWNQGQPDNAGPGEYCGAIFANAKLDDYWCDKVANFICEKDPKNLLD